MKKQLSQYLGNVGYFVGTEFGSNFFRFGMTKNGRSPYDRWEHDGDYRKCGSPAQFDHEFYELGDKLDHDIHNLLKKCPGIRVAPQSVVRSPEVFECDQGLEFAKTQIENFISILTGKTVPIRAPLDMRPYQDDFVRRFLKTTGDFLLFAKCRAGKSVMALIAATEANYHSVLVISLRTSASNSWLKDPTIYTRFHEWDAIDLHDDDALERIRHSQAVGRRTLMVTTVQALDGRHTLRKKLLKLLPNGVDALYLDECHIGGDAVMVRDFKMKFPYGRLLEISGTAFDASLSYDSEHKFIWDYTREQKAKRDGFDWAQKLPTMDLTVVRYDSERLKAVYEDEPDRLSNIFTVINGAWQDSASVRSFFLKYFSHGGQAHKSKELFRHSHHIVMSLPSVAACQLAVTLFKKLNLPWVSLDITGDTGENQESIIEHVTKHTRTICFTYSANIVGVTIPQWDTVVHCRRSDSAAHWIQFSFRGGSTREEKWRVVDFMPEQAVRSIIEMVQITAEAEEESEPGDFLRLFLEYADTQEFSDGFKPLRYEELIGFACDNPVEAISHLCQRAKRTVALGKFSSDLVELFQDASKVKAVETCRQSLNSNNTNDFSNQQIQRTGTEATKSELSDLFAKIEGTLNTIPSIVALHVLDSPIFTVSQLLSSPYLESFTGVDRLGFERAIDTGWISKRALSGVVSEASLILKRLEYAG